MKFFSFLFFSFLFFSCELIERESNPTSTSDNIVSRHGFLEFPSEETFENTLKFLENASLQEIEQWEQKHNLVSMRSVFTKGIDEQTRFEENNKPQESQLCEYVKNNIASFVIDGNSMIQDYNCYSGRYLSVINANGIVKVGKIIYQYQHDAVKLLADGDISKLNALQNAKTHIPDLFISVNKVNRTEAPNSRIEQAVYCASPTSPERVEGHLDVFNYFQYDFSRGLMARRCEVYAKVTNASKNFWGNWSHTNTGALRIVTHFARVYRDGALVASHANLSDNGPYGSSFSRGYYYSIGLWVPIQNAPSVGLLSVSAHITVYGRSGNTCNMNP